ncbi:MAG: hypothetical protein GX447_04885 [Elusimicrobia bacterium]|nr:hypothetical protein [Elusimicrobiota bacterium]
MERNYFLKKENGKIRFFDSSLQSGSVDFKKRKKSSVALFIFAGFLAAILNYYIFISLYLSFRLYDLKIISLFFGFSAFAGSAYLIYSALSFSFFPISASMEINSQRYEFKNISKFFLFGPKYSMEGEDFYALLVFKGIFRGKLYFLNQDKEVIFFVQKEKNNFIFKRGKEIFGYFYKTSENTKIDLSKDLNSQIPPQAAFAACSFIRR